MDDDELERSAIAYSKRFQSIIAEARGQVRGGGIAHEDFWAAFGTPGQDAPARERDEPAGGATRMADDLVLDGCSLADGVREAWLRHFVAERQPLFLTDDLLALLPADAPVLARSELWALLLSRSAHDTYNTFGVRPEAQWLTALTGASFRSLPPPTQERLVAAQWELGRRQVYPLDAIAPHLPPTLAVEPIRSPWVAHPLLALDAPLWDMLAPPDQWELVRWFVGQQATAYTPVARDAVGWRTGAVGSLANTFCAESGPNCFATTLAAITEDRRLAETISQLWLPADALMRGLSSRGYRSLAVEAPPYAQLSDTVAVWSDSGGVPRHACYVCEAGVALNKDSQAWYTPRRFVALEEVIGAWAEDGYGLAFYQRASGK